MHVETPDNILAALQATVEHLHGVCLEQKIAAYLVSDELRRELPGACEGLLEQVFVREADGEMELALYIAPSVVQDLLRDDPHRYLHSGNLENYCIALEGVSHFVLLAWRFDVGRPISALELEIQAEVDKFVAAWRLCWQQGTAQKNTVAGLLEQMFARYSVRLEVPATQVERYHVASRAAEKFCRHLVRRYATQLQHRSNNANAFLAVIRAAQTYSQQSLPDKLRA